MVGTALSCAAPAPLPMKFVDISIGFPACLIWSLEDAEREDASLPDLIYIDFRLFVHKGQMCHKVRTKGQERTINEGPAGGGGL